MGNFVFFPPMGGKKCQEIKRYIVFFWLMGINCRVIYTSLLLKLSNFMCFCKITLGSCDFINQSSCQALC